MKLAVLLGFLACQLSLALSSPKVICYWPNWNDDHPPEAIDASLCTHIHYSFALLDEKNWAPIDSTYEDNSEIYKRLIALKKKNENLKVILSIGGWSDEGGKYSRLVANANHRQKFANNVLNFLKNHHFDGLDIDWEYPVCWQAECDQGHEADKGNFIKLLKASTLLISNVIY